MTRTRTPGQCRNCGAAAGGAFCSSCGASLRDARCAACDNRLKAGERFCGNCGASGQASGRGTPRPSVHRTTPLYAVGALMLAIAVFYLGAQRGSALAVDSAGGRAAGIATTEDISSLSPDERASRLYNRVMRYSESGSVDSARFFAPMAVQAYEMLGAMDAHRRYDIGMIHVVTGDSVAARALADTILQERPTHLLGLALAMRAARGDAARQRFASRLLGANPGESANPLPEYTDHRNDVERAIATAGSQRP